MTSPRPIIARGFANARPAITLWWLVAVCVFCVFGPTLAQAETLAGECRVFQRYMIDTSGLPVEFDYELVAANSAAPMPEGVDGTSYRWTFRRDDEDILKIPVDTETMAEGRAMYTYALRPVTTRLTDNLYYDLSGDRALEYTLELYTFDESVNGTPIVLTIVRNPDGTKVSDPGWYIRWRGNDSDDPGTTTPEKTTPDKKESDETERNPTSPDDANASATERSSSSYTTRASTGTGTSSRTSNTLTTGTSSERIAQTGDKSMSYMLAFIGTAGVAFLVAARLYARRAAGSE